MYPANSHYLAKTQSHWARDEQCCKYPISWEIVEDNYSSNVTETFSSELYHYIGEYSRTLQPIICAIINNNFSIINYIINKEPLVNDDWNVIAEFAAVHGNLRLIKYLENTGHVSDYIINYAIEYEHIPVIKYLLSKQYYPCWRCATVIKNLSLIKYIHKRVPEVTFSSRVNDLHVIKYIINMANVNTIIYFATKYNCLPIIKFLIKCKLLTRSHFLYSIERHSVPIMKYLLNKLPAKYYNKLFKLKFPNEFANKYLAQIQPRET